MTTPYVKKTRVAIVDLLGLTDQTNNRYETASFRLGKFWWRIILQPKTYDKTCHLGVFLESCMPNSNITCWERWVYFKITLSFENESFTRKFSRCNNMFHHFTEKTLDWGFKNMMPWESLRDFYEDNQIEHFDLKVSVSYLEMRMFKEIHSKIEDLENQLKESNQLIKSLEKLIEMRVMPLVNYHESKQILKNKN